MFTKLSDFSGTRVIIRTPEQAEALMRKFFALGGEWNDGSKKIIEHHKTARSLYFTPTQYDIGIKMMFSSADPSDPTTYWNCTDSKIYREVQIEEMLADDIGIPEDPTEEQKNRLSWLINKLINDHFT